MIQVRDRLKIGYKGRPTYAVDKSCPCRPCFNAHDCGYINSQGKWISNMHCATNYNSGCPFEFSNYLRPTHIIISDAKYRKANQTRKCRRCGIKIMIGSQDFNFMTLEAYKMGETKR